jgi:hypothetical protein
LIEFGDSSLVLRLSRIGATASIKCDFIFWVETDCLVEVIDDAVILPAVCLRITKLSL